MPEELFEATCDAGVARKVKLNQGIVVVALEIQIDYWVGP